MTGAQALAASHRTTSPYCRSMGSSDEKMRRQQTTAEHSICQSPVVSRLEIFGSAGESVEHRPGSVARDSMIGHKVENNI
ncbi:unnamed protein product [Lota lota]